MTLYLSRLTLNRSAGNAALAPLLDPESPAQALDAHHRLLWSVFADSPDRRRDFLWRADGEGRFFVLSQRPPAPTDLFAAPEVKAFAPTLATGDTLAFVLRANATKDRALLSRAGPGELQSKSRRGELVMDLLRDVPKGERAEARMGLADQADGVIPVVIRGVLHLFHQRPQIDPPRQVGFKGEMLRFSTQTPVDPFVKGQVHDLTRVSAS